MNKHNFFIVNDGIVKIIGLFDGHGCNGDKVSNRAMSLMLDYIRNRNDVFKTSQIYNATEEQIMHVMKKAFKYT